jgi:hypothetical protein
VNPTTTTIELERRVHTLADEARSLAVSDQESYDLAARRLLGIVALKAEIVDHHAEMKSRSYEAWRSVIAAEKVLLDPVTEAERIYKNRLGAYQTEQERIAAAAREQAEAEARAWAAKQRESEIEQAEAAGADPEEVAALCAEPLPVVIAEPPPSSFTKAAGISTANNWKGECVSLPQLVRAIADSKANIGLVMANETAINQLARATRGTLAVPGIRFFNQPTVRASRR